MVCMYSPLSRCSWSLVYACQSPNWCSAVPSCSVLSASNLWMFPSQQRCSAPVIAHMIPEVHSFRAVELHLPTKGTHLSSSICCDTPYMLLLHPLTAPLQRGETCPLRLSACAEWANLPFETSSWRAADTRSEHPIKHLLQAQNGPLGTDV
jgi:hypothetical protein